VRIKRFLYYMVMKVVMKLVITGSSGFVGNFLAKHFSENGIEVVGLDVNKLDFQDYENFRFVKCDVRDSAQVSAIFRKEKFSHVIHLAYLMSPQHDKKFEFDVDVNGSKNVFDAANSSVSVKQFIHFSSASIYGGWKDNPLWISEEHQIRPREWVYAQNKKIVEEYIFKMRRKDLRIVNFRMCTAAGPSYFKGGGLVNTLVKAPVWIKLDGKDTFMQFIHEDDVNTIVDLVINDKKIDGVFNLAPDSYASAKKMSVNAKFCLPFPKFLFKIIFFVLWHLRLSPASPTSVDLVAHSIVISPKKLMKKYGYRFKFSTMDAFLDDYGRRKKEGRL